MRKFLALALLVSGIFVLSPASVCAEEARADLALILAIDGSGSISPDDLRLQLAGHAAALRSQRVANVVTQGPNRQIEILVAVWAGPNSLQVLVPWRVIASAEDAALLADDIDHASVGDIGGSTAVGSALAMALPLFADVPLPTSYRTIDLASNGFSNSGPDPALFRDLAAKQNVTVNALVMLDEYDWLEEYYEENVVGGPAAFVKTVAEPENFVPALEAKLVQEIATLLTPYQGNLL